MRLWPSFKTVQPVAVARAPLAGIGAAAPDAERVRDVEDAIVGELHPVLDERRLTQARRPVPRRAHAPRLRVRRGHRAQEKRSGDRRDEDARLHLIRR